MKDYLRARGRDDENISQKRKFLWKPKFVFIAPRTKHATYLQTLACGLMRAIGDGNGRGRYASAFVKQDSVTYLQILEWRIGLLTERNEFCHVVKLSKTSVHTDKSLPPLTCYHPQSKSVPATKNFIIKACRGGSSFRVILNHGTRRM
jgi:hypothetical protein